MLSSIFVDRPRLAIVIAIVTTIAGALSLFLIPVAQYPDVVPPEVSVTTNYPGASAAIVDATIAQPVEAQVIGVDKMIYMKSVSGNDGSYTLTVSFELGTDPDINTVNVNNRVQAALSKLDSAIEGARLRFRPVVMTSLAFILGALSARRCIRRFGAGAPWRWNSGLWRNAAGLFPWHFRHPAALCELPANCRAPERTRTAKA